MLCHQTIWNIPYIVLNFQAIKVLYIIRVLPFREKENVYHSLKSLQNLSFRKLQRRILVKQLHNRKTYNFPVHIFFNVSICKIWKPVVTPISNLRNSGLFLYSISNLLTFTTHIQNKLRLFILDTSISNSLTNFINTQYSSNNCNTHFQTT